MKIVNFITVFLFGTVLYVQAMPNPGQEDKKAANVAARIQKVADKLAASQAKQLAFAMKQDVLEAKIDAKTDMKETNTSEKEQAKINKAQSVKDKKAADVARMAESKARFADALAKKIAEHTEHLNQVDSSKALKEANKAKNEMDAMTKKCYFAKAQLHKKNHSRMKQFGTAPQSFEDHYGMADCAPGTDWERGYYGGYAGLGY